MPDTHFESYRRPEIGGLEINGGLTEGAEIFIHGKPCSIEFAGKIKTPDGMEVDYAYFSASSPDDPGKKPIDLLFLPPGKPFFIMNLEAGCLPGSRLETELRAQKLYRGTKTAEDKFKIFVFNQKGENCGLSPNYLAMDAFISRENSLKNRQEKIENSLSQTVDIDGWCARYDENRIWATVKILKPDILFAPAPVTPARVRDWSPKHARALELA